MHNILYIHHRLNNIPNPLGTYLANIQVQSIPVTIAETTINSKSKIADIKDFINDLGALDIYTLIICDVPAISKKLLGVTKTHGLYKNIYKANGISILTSHTPKLFVYDKTKETEVFEDIALLKKYFNDNTLNNFVQDKDLDIRTYMDIHTLLSEHGATIINAKAVTIDIEATGLHVMRDTPTSISFSVSKTHACVCWLDPSMYAVLRDLLERMDGYHIYHNAQFDLKMLIRALYMDCIDDYRGMLAGLHILARNVHDTQVLAYLCLNSVSRPEYSLKVLAYPYLGNYGDYTQKDEDLLRYNAKDTIGTFYIYEKFTKLLKKENQVQTYTQVFRPTIKTLTLTELVGMPIDYEYTKKLYKKFRNTLDELICKMRELPTIDLFIEFFRIEACKKRNLGLKTKTVHVEDEEFQKIKFNPNSNIQLQSLLYEVSFFDLPVLATTKKGNPATDKHAIDALLVHKQTTPDAKEFLELLKEYGELYVITNTFLKAFIEDSLPLSDGSYRLFGNFRQGAVISGRLSCVHRDTLIDTVRGRVRIEDIRIGDYVKTHKNRYKRVSNTILKGIDSMYKISLPNGENIKCTLEHKFLTTKGEWITLDNLLNSNDSITIVYTGSIQHRGCSKSIFGSKIKPYNGQSSKKVRDYAAKCLSYIKRACASRKTARVKGNTLFNSQRRGEELLLRKVWNRASKLQGRLRQWARTLYKNSGWQEITSTQSSNGRISWIERITQRYRGTSHRWEWLQQRYRKLSFSNKRWASEDTCSTVQGFFKISEENCHYWGDHQVFDITVEDDASYLSHGLYSHNSSNVNLMNLPSHGNKHAKAVKRCFKPGKGKLFVGIDADSLEDKISALTTKDPNKLKLYIDGYDGHCVRAYKYYPERMPDITKELAADPSNKVAIINSIANKHPDDRQNSKTPTFALTYAGTTHTLQIQCGMDEDEAQKVYDAYHDEYRESTQWVRNHIERATEIGYVVGAFGLKLRTPVLAKTMKSKLDSPLAAQEARSAGNMLGQSYGMLNQRSTNEFMEYVWDSPFGTEILPTAQIHDAAYFEIFNRIEPIMFCNFHLPKTLAWQELPDIKHDIVKLSATLEVYYPSWANALKLPNNASKDGIINIANNRRKI